MEKEFNAVGSTMLLQEGKMYLACEDCPYGLLKVEPVDTSKVCKASGSTPGP